MKPAYRRVVLAVLLLLLLALLVWRFNTHDLHGGRLETAAADTCTHKVDLQVPPAAENRAPELPAADSSPAAQAPPANTPTRIPTPQPPAALEPEPALEGPEPKDGEKYVLGRVVDGDSGEAVAGASVWAANMREILPAVTANANGRFRFTGLPQSNKVKLLARREGFLSPLDYVEGEIAFGLKPLPKHDPRETGTEPRAVFFDARDIKFTWADLSATPVETVIRVYRGVQVQGRCQDEARNPIKGAFVSAKLLDFGGHVEVRSGPGGEFSLGSLPGGRRTLEISASNAGKEWGSCTILELGYPAQAWEVVITLRAKAAIRCKFIPLDPASKSTYLVQIRTDDRTSAGGTARAPAWGCGFNGFVEIGQRFRIVVVVDLPDLRLGMGSVVAETDWIIAQRETEVVVHEQLRTRVEASLDGLELDWNEIAEVTLTTGPVGSVAGSHAMIELPIFGTARTTVQCRTMVTETAEASFVVVCQVRFRAKPAREPQLFVSQTLTGAPGSMVIADLKPVSDLLGNLTVTVSNREYGYVFVAPSTGGRCVMMQLSLRNGVCSAPLSGFIEGQYRVWWLPADHWKHAKPPAWARVGEVKAGQTVQLEMAVPE